MPDWTVNQLTDEAVSPGGALTKLSGSSKPPSSRRKDCLARSMDAVRMGSMFRKPRPRGEFSSLRNKWDARCQ